MAALSLLVVLLALALTAAWLCSWPLLLCWRRLVHARPGIATFNVLALGMPVLVGMVLAAGAVWPAHSVGLDPGACHCDPASGLLHLCLVHPAGSLPLLPGAAFLLVWFGWRPARVALDVARRLQATARLRANTAWSPEPLHQVLLGDLGSPGAFTAGLLRSAVLVDHPVPPGAADRGCP